MLPLFGVHRRLLPSSGICSLWMGGLVGDCMLRFFDEIGAFLHHPYATYPGITAPLEVLLYIMNRLYHTQASSFKSGCQRGQLGLIVSRAGHSLFKTLHGDE